MNHLRTLLTTVALCVLIFQLATIQVSFSIPLNVFGSFSTAKKVTAPSPEYKPFSVRLVSAEPERDSALFVGDVLLARNVEHLMIRNGYDYPYARIDYSSISINPYVVGNFEAAIPQVHLPTPIRMIDFSVHEKFVSDFAKAGFTHVSLANNHALDFGQEDFIHTQKVLTEHGIEPVGHPKTFDESSVSFLDVGNSQVALVTLHTLERMPNVSEIRSVLQYASARSDVQVLFVHWGNEYELTHSVRQRDLAERFVDAGIDAIIGHHPHVVQDIELIDGVPVLYSLGNYIFDQYDTKDTQVGLIAQLTLENGGALTLFPVSSLGNLSQPSFISPQNHLEFLESLANRSDNEISQYIKSGVIPLNIPVATLPKMAIMTR